ncbi:hypothetical protein [Methanomethylophilus alvi]|uniref:hypothetical protein n=1 Tax=Methanomethylophilus alvi TaxID=1291540 RepID=UPI0037DDB365
MVDKKVIAIAAVAILAIAGVSAFMVVGNNDDGPKADTDLQGRIWKWWTISMEASSQWDRIPSDG